MSGNGNQVPLAPSQRGPIPYPRASTPHRPECYHPASATGTAYMPSTAGGAQSSAQAAMRVQATPQPSAPPPSQQDMSKPNMAGHSYVSAPNQTPQSRPQYPNFQYRGTQHASRPNSHPRQQQPFIPGTSAAATAPVMYHPTFVLGPSHMGIPQSYQQSRSNTPGYYPYMAPYISYNTPPSHTPSYYYTSNSQQLPTPNLQPNPPGGRSNPTTMVGPQGTPATPTAPVASVPQPQPTTHIHQPMPGIRPPTQQKRPSHRLAIIDPVTQQDIFSELYSNEQHSGDSSERQTPQPENTHSIAEEFSRMVNEVAKQPASSESGLKTNYVSKNVDLPPAPSSVQPQSNAITSINNNIIKADILTNVNENKVTKKVNLVSDVVVEQNETPVVSAISDSPVVVPKMPIVVKQLQKNSEQDVHTVVLEKNILPNKQPKQSKSKPIVPQREDVDQPSENSSVSGHTASSSNPAPVSVTAAAPAPVPMTAAAPAPLPQRIKEPRDRQRSEEKENPKEIISPEKDTVPTNKPNGPTSALINLVDSEPATIRSPTSQSVQSLVQIKQSPAQDSNIFDTKTDSAEDSSLSAAGPTATQLLSASIEKLAKDLPTVTEVSFEEKEESSAIQAQAKLTQSLASCLRANQPEIKMKDINLNTKNTDPDTANGNTAEKTETAKDDVSRNEKIVKSSMINRKSGGKMANETNNDTESFENGKEETDKISNIVQEEDAPNEDSSSKSESVEKAEAAANPPANIPKYNYNPGQWSPFNMEGKKCYDLHLMKQMKEDPVSKSKPNNAPLLEACNVIRTAPMQEPMPFTPITRTVNDSFLPQFAKGSGMGPRNNTPRDPKKDGRNMMPAGKGSVKLPSSSSSSTQHKQVIHVSLSRGEEIKLNETKDPWKPLRYKKENLGEDEFKTQELYKKFRGILNKLTPQKFETLIKRVQDLEINNQKRLEGVIDLVFEKAIEEPNFSEAYAAMCNKLSVLKVPADNATAPDQYVNFRGLIITRCQNQFQASKEDEQIIKFEKELAECNDPAKKKELFMLLEEENRRGRLRSVGNVRFIGELYKLKMLTSRIMVFCMKHLIDKLEEEKLECLCKLLTTIGEQVESEAKDALDSAFKKMQDIVDRKSNKISSRVRFMLQDVIELRKRRWVVKSVLVDQQPKMMDQIQKEAEQQQRHIELMNSNPMGGGGFRREEGGRGKRGDSRRQNSNSFMDNNWKTPRTNYVVDTSKLKVASPKNLSNIKLAPQNSGWNQGSGTKNTIQVSSNSAIGLTKTTNMYSVLENIQTDPTSLRGNKDMTPSYHSKGASIERSTFNSKGDFNIGSGGRSGSMGVARSTSSSVNTIASAAPAYAEMTTSSHATVPQEPLPEAKKKSVEATIKLYFINSDNVELVDDINKLFTPEYHCAVITEILNIALQKSGKEVAKIANATTHLVVSNTISSENFVGAFKEFLEFAPDLHIDIPMLYDHFGMFIAPLIERKHITFTKIFGLSEGIIAANQGHLFLKSLIRDLKDSMGPSFAKSKWQESGLRLDQWMNEDQVAKFIEDNKFNFLQDGAKVCDDTKTILSPAETYSKLLALMNSDENCDCIKGWVQDNLGKSVNEDWFIRSLTQAICEHALFGLDGREVPHFNLERMNKYSWLINDFSESQQTKEASCLVGIQQLVHRLEHPQGLTLEIFQYLHEQCIISPEGFITWEESELELEGKGVMMKALTSFFTNIKEAENEDSCSED